MLEGFDKSKASIDLLLSKVSFFKKAKLTPAALKLASLMESYNVSKKEQLLECVGKLLKGLELNERGLLFAKAKELVSELDERALHAGKPALDEALNERLLRPILKAMS